MKYIHYKCISQFIAITFGIASNSARARSVKKMKRFTLKSDDEIFRSVDVDVLS